jgi:hypothetical protein
MRAPLYKLHSTDSPTETKQQVQSIELREEAPHTSFAFLPFNFLCGEPGSDTGAELMSGSGV